MGMILKSIKKLFHTTVPAPGYLEDDYWFGSAVLSDRQMTIKEVYEHAVSDGQLLPEDDTLEPKDIHETIYRIATSSGKTTTQLNPTSVGGWQSGSGWGNLYD
tara:strand:- start:2001 stop:2309 length:309 start_codon:yes stop_codon:yes gene_type:complete